VEVEIVFVAQVVREKWGREWEFGISVKI